MQRYLKPFRLIVSIVTLLTIGFLFLDFRDSVSSAWFRALTWLQFIPSLLKFLQTMAHGFAVTAYGFVAVLLLTLLFGRIYCSYICPLGIFQDVISWCSKELRSNRKKKFRFRFALPKIWLRYSILIIVFLSLLTGSIFFLNILEPFSNFGRFVSDVFRPLYLAGNNVLVKVFQTMGSYALYPVTIAKTDPYALIIPMAMLALVTWLSVRNGRLYCNTICPVGTLLGLVSKVSLFKVRFDTERCNQCGQCMFACKSQCIDIKKQKVDFTRCVGCGNCMKSCDKNAIRYAWTPAKEPKLSEDVDKSKRKFIAGSLLFAASLGGLPVQAFAQNRGKNRKNRFSKRHRNPDMESEYTVSPPGSHNREHFTGSCTACHLCVSACPSDVLKPSFLEYGFFGIMQPYMDYDSSFCNYECVRCSEVCPNGAILPLTVEEKITTQIGVVRFIKNNCIVVTDETSCGACAEHCPTKAVRMIPHKDEVTIPATNPDICIGCGACEYACPVTPAKAIVIDGLSEHKKVQKPEEEKLKEKSLEEFPF